MANKVIIIGAGGLGREALMTLREHNRQNHDDEARFHFLGFVSDAGEAKIYDEPVLGDDVWALVNLSRDIRFVVAIGNPARRKIVAEKYLLAGFQPFCLVHPSAISSEYVHLGLGAMVLPGVVMTTDIKTGVFTLLNPRVSLSHDVLAGDFVTVGPGAVICGEVVIESDVEIGAGAVVLPRLTLGKGVLLGAGAVATRNLEPGKTYIGIPARPMFAKLSGTP